MRLHSQIRGHRHQGEQGYVLLLLLLSVALLTISFAIIVPTVTFEIKRDREEEMIHRGVQYSRAIRAYYKKFGRYPAKIEDLENTNQIRFLRKRYKDPITGKDFKLLHYGEAKLSMNGIAGGAIAGATPVSNLSSSGGLGQTSNFGGNSLGQTSNFGGNSGFGNNSNSLFAQNSQSTGNLTTGTNPGQAQNSPPDSSTNTTGPNGTDANGTANSGSGNSAANTQFGGAPIVGVASTSKDPTIREYDHKKKYNEWQFVYDPTLDQGHLITTPYQPQIQMLGGQQNLNGQNNSGQNGQNGNSSGFSNSFGNGSGNSFGNSFGNSPNNSSSPGGGGYNNTNQPQSPPQQQQ